MLLNWLFGKKSGPGSSKEASASDYVEWLLGYMLRTSSKKILIRSSVPLPGSDLTAKEKGPPCVPSALTVMNRLKLLSGLNPVHYAEPVSGQFEKLHETYKLLFTTHFEESSGGTTCTIDLRIRPRA